MTNPSFFTRRVSAALVASLSLLLATGTLAGSPEAAGPSRPAVRAEGVFAPAPAKALTSPKRRLPASRSPARIVLDRPGAGTLANEMAGQSSGLGAPFRIGFGRDVAASADPSRTSALLDWGAVAGARVAAISVTSTDAMAVRLGLYVEGVPESALVRFYSQAAEPVFEVTGREIMDTIGRNVAAGDGSNEARTYWSPVIEGQEATVEIEIPDGTSADEVRLALPRISHLFSSPLNTRALQEKIGQSSSCNLDSMCYAGTWANESLAVARMTFTTGGLTYLCTGSLITDVANTLTPYFLSANHCIDSQTTASSLQTYWFYRSTNCDSGVLNPGTRTLTGGATLLYANTGTDTSFMRLNAAPPAGAWYSGWTSSLASLGAGVTGIHNPAGDLQKISFATIMGYAACVPSGPGTFFCTTATSGSGDHLKIVLSQGMVEGGSSGSGLWVTSGASHYLVGQLHGGSSTCALPTAPDYYGRFDVAYNAALHQWLNLAGAATQVSPSGTIGAAPTYTWNAVSNATHYYVYVNNAGTWYTAGGAGCGAGTGTCSVTGAALPPGDYTWFVLTYNAEGIGAWSSGMNFTVAATGPPAAATQIGPSGTVTGAPVYAWNAVSNASYYFLYLSNGALTYYSSSEAGCASGTGTCSITGPLLASGSYLWFVLTWNVDGAGPWSSGMSFTVDSPATPAAAGLVSPSGTISGTPTYTWGAVSNALAYAVYVNGTLNWYDPATAGCGSGMGTCSVAGTALPAGSYTWFVLTWNTNGIGPWSTGMGFTVMP